MKRKKLLYLGLIVGMLIALVTIGGCVPGGEPAEGGSSTIYMIGFLVLIFALFYFVMIRPQRKKQKEHQQMTQELKRGDKVMTIGGIYGQIESISEDSVVIKVESGTTIRMARTAVAGVKGKEQ
ncbi:preprotein translocase subunit YajC [Chloroflexota bacterium]